MSDANDKYPVVHWIPEKGPRPKLTVRRARANAQGPAVVLLHGGNTGSSTFNFSADDLATFLAQPKNGYNVWLIDWRGSPQIIEPIVDVPAVPDVETERRAFSLDTTANDELPRALDFIRREIGSSRYLAVVAHCLSGAATSMSISRGHLDRFEVKAYVLMTLGLFFRSCWDGWIKAEDYLLEKVLHTDAETRHVPPHRSRDWAGPIRDTYFHWPRAWLPKPCRFADDPLEQLTYMFGQPYERAALNAHLRPTFWSNLLRRLRGERSPLSAMFGPMHLGLYLHVGQMVRRGHAAPFDASLESIGDLNPEHFKGKRITLLTGAENRLWHRDAIDLMYEWLRSTAGGPGHRFQKHVLSGYGHQELLWGAQAGGEVFNLILEGIQPPH